MKIKRALFISALILLLLTMAVYANELASNGRSLLTVHLLPQQTIMIYCAGDEMIVAPLTINELQATCRQWVR